MKSAASAFWMGCALIAAMAAASGQTLAPPDQVLGQLRRVNERFMSAWSEPGRDIVTDRARPSNIWTRATYFEGLMALYKVDPDPRYYEYAVRWAESHQWKPAYGSLTDRNADNQCCGQTYLDLYAIDPRPERIAPIRATIDAMVNTPKADDWYWIDALQMAMPVFARLGVVTGDSRYFEKMHALYAHTRYAEGGRGLYHPLEHLWWRDADFDPPYEEPNGANCYWSRGNGWVFAALVRVLDILPTTEPHRAEYLRTFQEMAAALAPVQRLDGFWNASLMDPDNYGGRELTGTAFFAYGMAWGIRHGHLPRATYLPVVARAWQALAEAAVRPDGSLGYIQGSGKQPSDRQPVTYDSNPDFDDFGTGAFLLAGSEVHKLGSLPTVDYIGLWKTWTNRTPFPGEPMLDLIVEFGGTNLGEALNHTALRLVRPDGHSIPLTWSPAILVASRAAGKLDAEFPVGLYTLFVGESAIGGIRLGGTGGNVSPPETVAIEHSNAARPTLLRSAEIPGVAEGETRIHVDIRSRSLTTSMTWLNPPGNRALFTLPAYTFSAPDTISVAADYDCRTFHRAAVDLGRLGSPTVEAGIRRIMTASSASVIAPTQVRERLLNASSRGMAAADHPLIAGFAVSDGGPKMVLIRAVGPGLQSFGVTGALANPYLRVHNASRTRAWQNDDWQGSSQHLAFTRAGSTALQASFANPRAIDAAAQEAGAFPLAARSRDAALVLVLPPGNYTAQVTPSGSSVAGHALLEVYELTTTQTNPRLTNLSTRGTASPDEPITTGFVVAGGRKTVLVRAVGPTLAALGIFADAVLPDPRLEVFDQTGRQRGENDNWTEAAGAGGIAEFRARVGAFPLASGSRDAELQLTLEPGVYTARISSADGGSGTVLAEIYTEPPGS